MLRAAHTGVRENKDARHACAPRLRSDAARQNEGGKASRPHRRLSNPCHRAYHSDTLPAKLYYGGSYHVCDVQSLQKKMGASDHWPERSLVLIFFCGVRRVAQILN